MKCFTPAVSVLLSLSLLQARQAPQSSCGTHYDKWREEVHLHHQAEKVGIRRFRNAGAKLLGEREIGSRSIRSDVGNIAVLDDADGVVARRNPFNLNKRTIKFIPQDSEARRYRFEVSGDTYDLTAAQEGNALAGLDDDDSRRVTLPFNFSFFGRSYREIFVNSDGNVTFGAGDAAITDRSLGRLTSGLPRMAGLFRDLDPTRAQGTGGVKVAIQSNRFVITWDAVPEYREVGLGATQTFQLRLYPDGTVEMAYFDCSARDAVAGITPGRLQGSTSVVSFVNTPSGEYSSTVAERFAAQEEIDIFAAAQKFYLNHEDAYDYLVIYNSLGIYASDSAVAYEVTVRNSREGYGDAKIDVGHESGSKRRLQAILNMGPLNQYPKDPNARVPSRLSTGDTPLTVIAHETGHLFLAFASVRDAHDPEARPMLGRQTAHWNFTFNSDASLLEGNRITDNGPGLSPRFLTTATVEGFSALDQYMMGLRAAEEVPDTFLVTNPRGGAATGAPRIGVAFDGDRRDIRIAEIIQAEGRRTPDHTVAQRRFRFAFIIVTPNGADPSPEDLQQIEAYRREYEGFLSKVTSGNAQADTSIKKAVQLSTWPAVGVTQGLTATGMITLERPSPTALTVVLRTRSGAVEAPASVTVPAGATQVGFLISGRRVGTDDIIAEPADEAYETVQSRVNVAAATDLRLAIVSGNLQTARPGIALPEPVQIRVTDVNNLPYPGIMLRVTVGGGGSVDQNSAITDENGIVALRWTPGNDPINELQVAIPNGTTAVATALSRPNLAATSVVNAASFAPGLTPGAISTIFGANLGDEVLINGRKVNVFYSTPRQLNFLVPSDLSAVRAEVVVRNCVGASDAVTVAVSALGPGIFFDAASGYGAALVAGSGRPTQQHPAAAGEVIEIYTTGLGPLTAGRTDTKPEVHIAGMPAQVEYSGLAPGFVGLYQVNARVPVGVPAGVQIFTLAIGGLRANEVKVQIR